LLLKNGVTRESLLGYRVNLFSQKALETFNSIRLEQALDLLLDCYRDIRYSVSPRFELETAVSKLSWLNKWISMPELKNAVENARITLHGSSNQTQNAGQVQSAAPKNTDHPIEASPAGAGVKDSPRNFGPSLSDEFRRIAAKKESGETDEETTEDDVPLWDNIARDNIANRDNITDKENIPEPSAEGSAPENTQVERVLRVIPGIVIN
jgi:hypothetical protein